ncbi:MAG: hypothetical protein JXK05_08485 [Campylobacterales bacterium]|nr:hypothetical protein [Campylobacterales bacterium]
MQRQTFDALLSFMLGAVWAFIVVGAFVAFSLFSILGYWVAIVATFIFLFIAFLIVLLLEALLMFRRSEEEKRRQSRLIEELHQTLLSQKSDD